MMNYLTSMKIASDDNLVSVHISMFYAQRPLAGVAKHLAERRWGTKTSSVFKMGYENFFCVQDGVRKLLLCSRWGHKTSSVFKMGA